MPDNWTRDEETLRLLDIEADEHLICGSPGNFDDWAAKNNTWPTIQQQEADRKVNGKALLVLGGISALVLCAVLYGVIHLAVLIG